MHRINHYILLAFILLGELLYSQNSIRENPEIIQNTINYYISEAQKDIDARYYFEAQKKLEEALTRATKIDSKKSLGILHSLKAMILLTVEEGNKALDEIEKAIEIQKLIKDDLNIGKSYKILGDIHVFKNHSHQALEAYKVAKSKLKVKELNKLFSEVLLAEGKIHIKLNNSRKARALIKESINISKKHRLLKIKCEALAYYGKTFAALGEPEKGLEFVNQSIDIAKEKEYYNIINDAYFILSTVNDDLGDYELSNFYIKAHIDLSDSLRLVKKRYISSEKKINFLLDTQKEQAIRQKVKLEEANNKKDLSTLISILSIALITILSLLTLSLYKNNNIRLKTNNILHKKNGELIIAKEKAELASKTKANFLSTVTHELRTPLYAVTGLSSMLLDEDPKPQQVQHLKSLKFSGEYLLSFINDILQINKIEASKVDLEEEPFNLKKKMSNIILSLNNSALDNNVKMHFEYGEALPETFIADQLKISQILINLIGNSIKFTDHGDIWIRVSEIDRKDKIYTLCFEIEDNGIGISQEKQNNMFESFSQGSIQINRKYGGTGLGLSIVKGLIDILKGKIYVKSELGKGTTFYFEIQLEYTSREEAKEINYFNSDNNELDLTNVKILVVEDNKINQMITKKILTKMKLHCEVVDNGEDAVDLIRKNTYDIILMDIHMPGISGIEATKIVRTFDENLTIFALTAVTIDDKKQEFEEAGFTDIIPKPFRQEEFEKKLYNALMSNQNKSTVSS